MELPFLFSVLKKLLDEKSAACGFFSKLYRFPVQNRLKIALQDNHPLYNHKFPNKFFVICESYLNVVYRRIQIYVLLLNIICSFALKIF